MDAKQKQKLRKEFEHFMANVDEMDTNDLFNLLYSRMYPKWISVSERLPKSKVDVLVYMANPHHLKKGNVCGVCRYNELGFWENLSYYDMDVTHWQPLPNIPVECKHEGDEVHHQGDGFVYTTCADCGADI